MSVEGLVTLISTIIAAISAYLIGLRKSRIEILKIKSDITDGSVERSKTIAELSLQLIKPLQARIESLENDHSELLYKVIRLSEENVALKKENKVLSERLSKYEEAVNGTS